MGVLGSGMLLFGTPVSFGVIYWQRRALWPHAPGKIALILGFMGMGFVLFLAIYNLVAT